MTQHECLGCGAPKATAAPGVVCESCGATATVTRGPLLVPPPDETRQPQPPVGCLLLLAALAVFWIGVAVAGWRVFS